MSHSLGVYFAPEHSFEADRDYIAKLQPRILRILDPDVQHIADMHALCPNAIIAPRTWAIDDGSDEDHPSKQVNRLMADPVGTAHDHAQQYKAQWDRWQQEAAQRGLTLPPVERILFNSANEPNQGGTADKIAAYSVAFLDRCTELGIHACAPCLGVGWPDNSGPGTPVDWTPYIDAGLEQAIKRNGGMLSVHEYFYKTGPQDGWGWLAGRHLQCPLDVPIVLGEIGIDNYVYNARWLAEPSETRGNRGWQGNVTPDQYAEMIEWHIRHSDKRIVSALIFITDVRNNSWESFNTRPAHGALLARKDNMIPQAQPPKPSTVHIPAVGTGTQTRYVIAPSGARIRSAPVINPDNILTAVPYNQPVQVAGTHGEWSEVGYGFVNGWMYSDLLGDAPVDVDDTQELPPVASTQDNFDRAIDWVLQWEGGYQNVANDKGNWTGCEVGKGENKGTKFGISACSYPDLDIQNLSVEEARAIYEQDYWRASGADKLPWPYCLLVLDTAVLHGVGTARQWQAEVGTNPYAFAAKRLHTYTKLDNWNFWGKGWTNRTADLLEEMSA